MYGNLAEAKDGESKASKQNLAVLSAVGESGDKDSSQ